MADELVLGEGAADGEILRSIVFKGKEIKITFEPPDGRLIRIVGENLDEKASSEEKFDKRKVNIKEEYLAQMKALKESLNLEYMPECIEGIDISHSSGDNMVGSLVVFKNGEPDKKNYRHFNIKTVGQVDDYASINEVVERRYSRLKAEGEYFPDIILVDGGPGQVSAAREGLNRVGVDILLLGLAKEHEEVFRSGQKGPVPVSEKAGFLLMRVRDEAHRFANSLRKKLANRDLKASIFDSIGGIGEKTKYKIYNGFRDFDELAAAIENGDDRASFLNKKQKESVLAAIRGKK
jgi:excinuclease ABC subunit C